MPVGTYGTVKAMTPEELHRPRRADHSRQHVPSDAAPGHGSRCVRTAACIGFMHWEGPILTDSGGFQVFSLATLRKITEEGVSFRSPVNGDPVMLTPERSMQVQRDLDSDIVMIFDECTPYPATEEEARRSMELSLRWAARSRAEFDRLRESASAVRHRAGRHVFSPARGVDRRTDAHRLRRLRDRRARRRRAERGARTGARSDRARICRAIARAI